jgi:hypothetical protein
MAHRDARMHLDAARLPAGRSPCEDLDGEPGIGHPLGRLDDVDVHSARVAAARRVERRGVDAQHRDALHSPMMPPMHNPYP